MSTKTREIFRISEDFKALVAGRIDCKSLQVIHAENQDTENGRTFSTDFCVMGDIAMDSFKTVDN